MICAYQECSNEFEARTHNQKYCSDECCRTATNIKIKERYYENKARLNGKKRICKTSLCKIILSRYNESSYCAKCQSKEEQNDKSFILRVAT